MAEYVFGGNIFNNLTTGMYTDSKVIYREYIQNCCDQIDTAIKENLLNSDEGHIDIQLDKKERTIIIEDNATGIPSSDFARTLGDIAASDKIIGKNRGFRGIGRLCGLAYCETLIFESSAKGESKTSVLTCDAKKLRSLMDKNYHGEKLTAQEMLNIIYSFNTTDNADPDNHFFRVKLIKINDENTDLLDFAQVKNFLSFIAPVPYQSSFIFRNDIRTKAKAAGLIIDEYNITLNGEPVFKKYSTVLKDSSTGQKYDEVFDIAFKEFYDECENPLAWMWIGLSSLKKAIPKINAMRGIRLRQGNIQIGAEDTLQKLFKEDRGNSYFVGEVFALDKNLTPNSQRDYFEENSTRHTFERQLKKYFNEELYKIYHNASAINSAYKRIDEATKKETEFAQKEASNSFINNEQRQKESDQVTNARKEAEKAESTIQKVKSKATPLLNQVINRIEKQHQEKTSPPFQPPNEYGPKLKKSPHRVDKLTQYSKSERKLISRIWDIIYESTEIDIAEQLVSSIEQKL
jgi:hypothetical protein